MITFWNEEELQEVKDECRKELLENLLKRSEDFGGILPIRVLRNMLKRCSDYKTYNKHESK